MVKVGFGLRYWSGFWIALSNFVAASAFRILNGGISPLFQRLRSSLTLRDQVRITTFFLCFPKKN